MGGDLLPLGYCCTTQVCGAWERPLDGSRGCFGCSRLCRGPGLELGSCPIPGQRPVGSQEVQKESPPDQLRISLYYLNPLYTTTKNKKTLLNSLRYENYKLCTSTAVSARVEAHGLWWLNLRPHTAGTPSPSSLHPREHRATAQGRGGGDRSTGWLWLRHGAVAWAGCTRGAASRSSVLSEPARALCGALG